MAAGAQVLVLGLGNPVRGDDGVGLEIVQRLRRKGLPDGVEVAEAGTAGLAVLDLLGGQHRLVIVDAIDAGLEPGSIVELELSDLDQPSLHLASSHELDLPAALQLGRRLGLAMPEEVRIVAVQVADTSTFSEHCTPQVAAAVDRACAKVLEVASGIG